MISWPLWSADCYLLFVEMPSDMYVRLSDQQVHAALLKVLQISLYMYMKSLYIADAFTTTDIILSFI